MYPISSHRTELILNTLPSLFKGNLLHALLCFVSGMINFINQVLRSNSKCILGVKATHIRAISSLGTTHVPQLQAFCLFRVKVNAREATGISIFSLKSVFNSCHQGPSLQLNFGSKEVLAVVVSCFSINHVPAIRIDIFFRKKKNSCKPRPSPQFTSRSNGVSFKETGKILKPDYGDYGWLGPIYSPADVSFNPINGYISSSSYSGFIITT